MTDMMPEVPADRHGSNDTNLPGYAHGEGKQPAGLQEEGMEELSRVKHNAEVRKQIEKLRTRGLRHRAKASGYLVKAKKAEAKAASLMHKANRMKQESAAILEKAREKAKAAVEYQKRIDASAPMTQNSDAEMQMSRLEHDEARLTRQANQLEVRAAGTSERASKMKRRSVEFMQKQRTHEVESGQYLKKAEDLDKLKA